MTKIALVDDEINILKALRRALGRQGWEILTFNSPTEALKELEFERIDLVISDYKMPEMSGTDFLKKLEKLQPDACRIILSGQADLEGLTEAINKVGIYRFILKPWSDEELRLTIKHALEHSKLEQENKELVKMIRKQRAKINDQMSELRRLEKESPGITQLDISEDGAIDLSDEFDDD